MEYPLRASENVPATFSRVENVRRQLATSAGLVPLSLVSGKERSGEVVIPSSNAQQEHEGSKDNLLGQFSFAPATQTTVVTTTTTTTTSFPPLMIKAPHHLYELDSKLYPLASTPTPKSIKRFCFDVGGKPTYFNEAENTLEALRGVCHAFPDDIIQSQRELLKLTCLVVAPKSTGSSEEIRWCCSLSVEFPVRIRHDPPSSIWAGHSQLYPDGSDLKQHIG